MGDRRQIALKLSDDTIDKVDPEELSQNVAVLATVAYILADMPHRIGE